MSDIKTMHARVTRYSADLDAAERFLEEMARVVPDARYLGRARIALADLRALHRLGCPLLPDDEERTGHGTTVVLDTMWTAETAAPHDDE